MCQVLEIELGEYVEVMLGENDNGEEHCGIMEVVELFEDDQVLVRFCSDLQASMSAGMQCTSCPLCPLCATIDDAIWVHWSAWRRKHLN